MRLNGQDPVGTAPPTVLVRRIGQTDVLRLNLADFDPAKYERVDDAVDDSENAAQQAAHRAAETPRKPSCGADFPNPTVVRGG